jgi:hypothetical protein
MSNTAVDFNMRKSAPGRTRTCDPRLRRVGSCAGDGLLFSRLRGLPRGRATLFQGRLPLIYIPDSFRSGGNHGQAFGLGGGASTSSTVRRTVRMPQRSFDALEKLNEGVHVPLSGGLRLALGPLGAVYSKKAGRRCSYTHRDTARMLPSSYCARGITDRVATEILTQSEVQAWKCHQAIASKSTNNS